MADPQSAVLSQLRNIETRLGQAIPVLQAAVLDAGLEKVSARRSWLMQTYGLGYGDANAVANLIGKLPAGYLPSVELAGQTLATTLSPAQPTDEAQTLSAAVDALYSGPKAALRPVHDAVMAAIHALGTFEVAPKKGYLSLRRRKQFAMVGPATRSAVEIGLDARDLPAHERLKVLPPGGMCQATLRLSTTQEVDDDLRAWLGQAYASAA